ncbi:PREDICTED: uncharacterized protein LOC109168135 [Ipomoea nil]|uniref:uncharacterized protein LOC109168135 n=1 Tax=Ipomoea nil TaxID=35883 RepID=UPI000901E921|nr:PREDICTED: uncharacterized protein LOC109168135 [Ipomoea nil]
MRRMENGGLNRGKITVEDMISKLKDDGDYDRLRLKIVRKVRDDEDLRNSIMSTLRQSEALNCPSAKRMKPRQLSDAVYQEVGTKVMSEISDGIWKVIRSGEGMKNEITETVQSVYNKLVNPNVNEEGQTSYGPNLQSAEMGVESNGHATSSACETNGTLSNSAPNETPGFARSDLGQNSKNNHGEPGMPVPNDSKAREVYKLETQGSTHCSDPNDEDTNAPPPGFSNVMEHKQSSDVNDEDPDVPPGFG